METSKMTSEALKVRAKNLRNAVEGMFRVSVTHSQALELVAREENYPTWDAACASFKPSSTQDVGKIGAHEVSNLSVHQMLAPSSSSGALIVVWGVTGQGKTSTVRVIVEDLIAQQDADKPTDILHVGLKEFPYPERVSARYIPGAESILRSGQITESLVVVDELRDPYAAFEVVAMVLDGAKVIVTLHAKSPVDRLRALLKAQGMGELLLERLLENGQVMAITARR
ncbi:ATPase, T2SS/T4P/T4SS family [Pseudomonas sp. EMN2]|uniref:glyoxalase superfamily protein n=1 Tax=Pseudomonas sp. EMN2 TaxID=2615212 RepID=UPI00129B7D44|nr:ATPase, T2SS/T4P/T4SS family [Pseudomonas sp. EMN2]